MLRITVISKPHSLSFQLEGRLAGPWVEELEHCWQNASARSHPQTVHFDLTGVTFVDAAGKDFLSARHAEGVQFVASGCLMRALVAEITRLPVTQGINQGEASAPRDIARTNLPPKNEVTHERE